MLQLCLTTAVPAFRCRHSYQAVLPSRHGPQSCQLRRCAAVPSIGPRSLPYFRSGLPAVCHLQPQPITTYTWTATHLHIAALQTHLGLAYTRTSLQSQCHSLSLWSPLRLQSPAPVSVSLLELVLSPCVSTVSVCTMSMVSIHTCFDLT